MSPKNLLTIADIARLAGVSKSTVSRALNDSPLIGDETKARVQRIAHEHNFQLNVPAQRLSTRRSHTIAFVTHAYHKMFNVAEVYAGLDVIDVPGATGLIDTNYEGKADACLAALEDHDFVYVHVEATDEAGHARDVKQKVLGIEYLDSRLVTRVMKGIEEKGIAATVAVLPDHLTPVARGNHVHGPVPVAILTPGTAPDSTQTYDEPSCASGSLGMLHGSDFIRTVLNRNSGR